MLSGHSVATCLSSSLCGSSSRITQANAAPTSWRIHYGLRTSGYLRSINGGAATTFQTTLIQSRLGCRPAALLRRKQRDAGPSLQRHEGVPPVRPLNSCTVNGLAMSVTRELPKIRQCQQSAMETFLTIAAKIELLQPIMKDPRVVSRFRDGHRPRARDLLISSLYLECVLDLLSISLDTDRRAASVANVLRLLRVPAVRRRLRTEFSAVPDPLIVGSDSMSPELVAVINESVEKSRDRDPTPQLRREAR